MTSYHTIPYHTITVYISFNLVPDEPPKNVAVVNVNVTDIELSWLPPNVSDTNGILRYYNLSYRVLNDSSSEIISLSLVNTTLRHVISNLLGLSLVQINISAFTIGSGPVQTIMVLTEEGGE